jgi:hypothetical protein
MIAIYSKHASIFRALVLAVLVLSCAMTVAIAVTLEEAKSGGLVAELQNGYLASVPGKQSKDVSALINSVNAKRREKYSKIANKRGVPIEAVEKLAGKTAITKSGKGEYVQQADGSLVKK